MDRRIRISLESVTPSLAFAVLIVLLPPPPTAVAQQLTADVSDVVDGTYLVRPTLDGTPISSSDGLTWETRAGSGSISEDPFTHMTMIRASGTTPLVVRPSVGPVIGVDTPIGIDPGTVPAAQLVFAAAGGGVCFANPNHASCFSVTVDVRSILEANVIPRSLSQRELHYQYGEYYSSDPIVGPMRITYNPQARSRTVLTSLVNPQTARDPFFPATAHSEFFFQIDFLASGISVVNTQPMVFETTMFRWPPFAAPLEHQSPVTFYFASDPNTACMTIQNQYMSLYPTTELAITSTGLTISATGHLQSTWRITNTSANGAAIRWFFIGNLGTPESPTRGSTTIGAAGSPTGSVDVAFDSQLDASTLSQFVTLGAVSESGPRLTGAHKETFRFPGLEIQVRLHGSSQFPGDHGEKDWFIRADPAGTIVDDFISATIVVDNSSGHPIANQQVHLAADLTVLNPKLGLRDMTSAFRLVSNPKVSLASGNPYTWAPGRTRFEANIPAAISRSFQAALPVNVPFVVRNTTPSGPTIERRDVLGFRPHRGFVDDGSPEGTFFAESPSRTGDVLATRFSARRLFPHGVSQINVTGAVVVATSSRSNGGFDAIQLRRHDPILEPAADESPQGLLAGRGGVGDGMTDVAVPFDPNGLFSAVSVPFLGAPVRIGASDDLWLNVYMTPGDTVISGTFLGEDRTEETILGDAFFLKPGATPPRYAPREGGNWMTRLTFTVGP
ncbi:MAG: hypothetical protein HYR85_24410 [Planctomycetes bacterium]|nr:hypothetical protein [Planctomycetota bacterium]